MSDWVVPLLFLLLFPTAVFSLMGLMGSTNPISMFLLRPLGGYNGARALLTGEPRRTARKVAVTGDELALFLHEVELGAKVHLLTTAAGQVYVTRRQLRRIRRYLRANFLPKAAPELVFREYGWELCVTQPR